MRQGTHRPRWHLKNNRRRQRARWRSHKRSRCKSEAFLHTFFAGKKCGMRSKNIRKKQKSPCLSQKRQRQNLCGTTLLAANFRSRSRRASHGQGMISALCRPGLLCFQPGCSKVILRALPLLPSTKAAALLKEAEALLVLFFALEPICTVIVAFSLGNVNGFLTFPPFSTPKEKQEGLPSRFFRFVMPPWHREDWLPARLPDSRFPCSPAKGR